MRRNTSSPRKAEMSVIVCSSTSTPCPSCLGQEQTKDDTQFYKLLHLMLYAFMHTGQGFSAVVPLCTFSPPGESAV